MITIKDYNRIKNIEDRFNSPVKDLLYQIHWTEDMRHRVFGSVLNVPRSTITKWFHYFGIPTQSCRRFTDKNLTSWLYKIGKLQKKVRYEGPDRRLQRSKGALNVDFFKKWSPKMAYVLGYFCADGCMYQNSGGSKYINFVSTDFDLLDKVKKILGSMHKIAPKIQNNPNCKPTFWLQIGCREIYEDMVKLGLVPKKAFRLNLPNTPSECFRDFVRGYFDGDGCISYGLYKRRHRKCKAFILMTRFTSCSKKFLDALKKRLHREGGLKRGSMLQQDSYYRLTYSKEDSKRLFKYMYNGATPDYYLERKYNRFCKALEIIGDVV
ncbi:MAG: hypothetical protein HZA30_02770 [Candidatus Omnitrophica bacterium]|nr:hypothetical protein [Candidatus Omnitrophota bacterium]